MRWTESGSYQLRYCLANFFSRWRLGCQTKSQEICDDNFTLSLNQG